MSLNLNAPNFAGLSSGGPGNASITVPGSLGLQAFQLKLSEEEMMKKDLLERMQMKQAQEDSMRKDALAKMQLRQQGEMGLRQNMLDRDRLSLLSKQSNDELALKKSALGQENSQQQSAMDLKRYAIDRQDSQFKDELGMKQLGIEQDKSKHLDEMGLRQQELFQKSQAMEMKKLLEEDKQSLKSKGAFASHARLALEQTKSPQEAQQLRTEILNEAVTNGYLSKEEAKMASQVPLSNFKQQLEYKILQYGKVSEYKSMLDANKEKTPGSYKVTTSDGTVMEYSGPTKAVESEAQKDIKSKDLALEQLKQIEEGYDKSYFTDKGSLDNWASTQAERKEGIPLIGAGAEALASTLTGKSKEERSEFLDNRKNYMDKVDQLFNAYKKEITGAAAGEKELEQLRASFLNSELSPSQFLGSLRQVVDKYKSESKYNKDILKKGVDTTSPNLFDEARKDPRYKDWSDDKIKRALKMLEGNK